MSPVMCRFSDAGNDDLTTRCGGRRPKSAKARNRVGSGGVRGWCGRLDEDQGAAAAGGGMLWFWRFGSIGPDCFDGIDVNYWRREQLAGAGDVLGALAAGEQAIVADAMEACGQHVHQETA